MAGSQGTTPELLAGRYRILDEIGRGGMGIVLRARDLKHERDVAVKVLRADVASAVDAQRFHREIHIAAGLTHPHILPIYDSGEDDGTLFYVMPRVEGPTLRERLDAEGRLPCDEVLRLGENVAAALDHAHARGIVHRDVKPENVFLSDGEALVGDFGLAVILGDAARSDRLTSSGLRVGTPRYMSPEQFADPGRVDARSDVFSFGVLLFECLTGHHPFAARDAEEPGHPLSWVAREPGELDDACPPALARFLGRCLAVAPGERLPEGRTLGEAFADVTREVSEERRRWSPWRWAPVAALGALAVAAVVTLAVALRPDPPAERNVVSQGPVVTWASREEEGRFVPGRDAISFLSDRGSVRNVWTIPVDGGEGRAVTDETDPVVSHLWSSDGTRLAYLVFPGPGHVLVVAGPDGRTVLETADLPPGSQLPRLVGWRDPRVYLIADGQLWSVNPPSTRLRQHPVGPGATLTGASLRPGSDEVILAVAREEGGSDLWLADLDGGEARRLTDDRHVDASPCWLGPDRVAFLSNRGGRMDVWTLGIPDGEPRAATTGASGANHIACSDDGSGLLVDREDERADLWLWDPGSEAVTQLTSDSRVDLLSSASPDGHVAFQRERAGLDVVDPFFDTDILMGRLVEGSLVGVRTLVEDAFNPLVSQDGRWVAFQRLPPRASRYLQLAVVSTEGREWSLSPRVPLATYRGHPPVGWEGHQVAWSPTEPALHWVEPAGDGDEPGGHLLLRARLAGEHDAPIVDTLHTLEADGSAGDLSVSPDGRSIAWVVRSSVRAGGAVHLVSADGTGSRVVFTDPRDAELHDAGWLGPEGPLVVVRSYRDVAPGRAQALLVHTDGTVHDGAEVVGGIAGLAALDPSTRTLLVPQVVGYRVELRRLALEDPADGSPPDEILSVTLGDVPFSGVEVLPDGRILFARHEVSPDIWRVVFADPD